MAPYIITGLVLYGYFLFSLHIAGMVQDSMIFSRGQKVVNIFLIWILPFFWGMVLKQVIFSDLKKVDPRDIDTGIKNWEELPGGGKRRFWTLGLV